MRNYLYTYTGPVTIHDVKRPKPNTDAGKAMLALAQAEDALRKAGDKATDVQRAAVEKAAIKAKSAFRFSPSEGAIGTRYNVSDETLAAWRAESDPVKRAAILAADAGEGKGDLTSPVNPSVWAFRQMRGRYADNAALRADLAAGILVIPSTGSGPSSKSAPKRDEDAILADFFGAADAPSA